MVQYFPVSWCCDCRFGIGDGSPVFSLLLLLFSCYENIKQVASASTGFTGKLTCMCWNSHLFQEGCSLRNVIIMNSNLGTGGTSTLGRYIQTQVNFARTVLLSVFSRFSLEQPCVYCKCLAFCLFLRIIWLICASCIFWYLEVASIWFLVVWKWAYPSSWFVNHAVVKRSE